MSEPAPPLAKPSSQLLELWLSREREFLREPGVLFWVFGFPVLLAVALGLAFRTRGPEPSAVLYVEEPPGVEDTPAAGASPADASPRAALEKAPLLAVKGVPERDARARYERGAAATRLLTRHATLEDVFLEVTGRRFADAEAVPAGASR